MYGDGETEPSRRRSAVVSDHSRDGRRDVETRQQENARRKMDAAEKKTRKKPGTRMRSKTAVFDAQGPRNAMIPP